MTPNVAITGIVKRLVQEGDLDEESARKAIAEAQRNKTPIQTYLQEKKLVSSKALAAANAVEMGFPYLNIQSFDLKYCASKLVSEEVIQKHQMLPLTKRGNRLFVALSDPTNTAGLDDLKFHSRCIIEPVVVDQETLRQAIDRAFASDSGLADLGDGDDLNLSLGDDGDGDEGTATGVDVGSDDTPVVKFVNKMLLDAIRRGASDIHFEPYEDEYRVRLRMDGVLKIVARAPSKLAPRFAARLKVMSNLDIAEKRLPQDGRIKLNITKTKQMDFRVSTCPTLFGEKIVLRMLDGGAAKLGIEKLGYEDAQKQLYLDALSKPYGMILVTGPTGSGKTVSLYTGLNILNTEERNISTAEDPVEIRVPGINQVQMNPKKGMTFAAALRSFLRQDPDVIMVGEIRDLETAEIAIKAAQTGHLVLSTLHTNDAPQTISRLMNMGIAPYNITSSVTLIIAQRLARRLCNACKRPSKIAPKLLLQAGFTQAEIDAGLQIFDAVGCAECNEGYKGRVGVYQVLPMSEEIQRIILDGGNAMQIADVAQQIGVKDLRQSALSKVREGLTSIQEADRVTKA